MTVTSAITRPYEHKPPLEAQKKQSQFKGLPARFADRFQRSFSSVRAPPA